MADKPEFVDMISEATRQIRRRTATVAISPAPVKERSRMSHWPPAHLEEWRAETLTPWRLRSRKRDWS